MNKLFILFCVILFVNCETRQANDLIRITQIINDEFGFTSQYYFAVGNDGSGSVEETTKYYFVDKSGLYKIGDTIFISSLRKNIKAEKPE